MRLQFCILPRTSMNGSPSSTGRYFYHLTRILLVRIFLSAADFVVVLEECKFVGTGKVLSKGERNGISEKCNQLKLPYVVFGFVSIFLIARMNCPPLVNNILDVKISFERRNKYFCVRQLRQHVNFIDSVEIHGDVRGDPRVGG